MQYIQEILILQPAGKEVLNFRSDLPGFGGVSRIVLDANFPQDQIALLSPDNLELLAMEPLSVTKPRTKILTAAAGKS